jgi:hypothetical protein
MTDSQSVRLDVRPEHHALDQKRRYRWVVQSTAPVRDLFESPTTFSTAADAVADFQLACHLIGWKNDITEVPVR